MTTELTAISGPSDPRFTGNVELNRVAETHYHLRVRLERVLDSFLINGEEEPFVGYSTYGAFWRATSGDRYFDMGTMQRLGTAIESGLRHYHRGLAEPRRAAAVARSEQSVFQRLIQLDDLVDLFRGDCAVNLADNPFLPQMREVMVHRHLFAHRSGLVDEKYLKNLLAVTGRDLRPELEDAGYPDEDVAYFEPLRRLTGHIEDARSFFGHLPSGRSEQPSGLNP